VCGLQRQLLWILEATDKIEDSGAAHRCLNAAGGISFVTGGGQQGCQCAAGGATDGGKFPGVQLPLV
jgi:hypothetical protein